MLINSEISESFVTDNGCRCIDDPLIGGQCKGHTLKIKKIDYGQNEGFDVYLDKKLLFQGNQDDLVTLAKLILQHYE